MHSSMDTNCLVPKIEWSKGILKVNFRLNLMQRIKNANFVVNFLTFIASESVSYYNNLCTVKDIEISSAPLLLHDNTTEQQSLQEDTKQIKRDTKIKYYQIHLAIRINFKINLNIGSEFYFEIG